MPWHCIFVLLALLAVSCTEEDRETLMTDVTFLIDCEEGSSAAQSCTFPERWQVMSVPEGFTVSPMSGESGTVSLTVTALADNPAIGEKVATLTVLSGQEIGMTVIQHGSPGLRPEKTSYNVSDAADTIEIRVGANVSLSSASDDGWIEIISTEASDSCLLSDGRTYSDSLMYSIYVGFSANTDNAERTGTVTLSYGEEEVTEITITQAAALTVDWDREFFRTSVFVRMTATWCYNCPFMSDAISAVQNEMPGRIIPVNVHAMSSEGGMAYYRAPYIEELYGITGYPTGIANNMVRFNNIRSVDAVADIVRSITGEAISSYPSRTGIDASSRLSNDSVYVDVRIAAKDAGQYNICMILLESGILYEQAGTGGGEYTHNSVLREILTGDLAGVPVTAESDNATIRYSLKAAVPRSVLDQNNLSLVIVVGRQGSPDTQTVELAEYLTLGTIWDNAAVLPANGTVGIQYED